MGIIFVPDDLCPGCGETATIGSHEKCSDTCPACRHSVSDPTYHCARCGEHVHFRAVADLVADVAIALNRVDTYWDTWKLPGNWSTPETGYPFAMSLVEQVAAVRAWVDALGRGRPCTRCGSVFASLTELNDWDLLGHRYRLNAAWWGASSDGATESLQRQEREAETEIDRRFGVGASDRLSGYFTASHADADDMIRVVADDPDLIVEIAKGEHICTPAPVCRCGARIRALFEHCPDCGVALRADGTVDELPGEPAEHYNGCTVRLVRFRDDFSPDLAEVVWVADDTTKRKTPDGTEFITIRTRTNTGMCHRLAWVADLRDIA